ncbi:MAG: Stp1/IreP family PP2C-type Ser/Thr phosphatase [Gammaproteobacteria bacterium]|nr:Stp1/IreP family PP2C-type Ser/Thr phosphatase [Gammaproteobacteria bacterium]
MTDGKIIISYAGGTDRGKVRTQNEDSILMSDFEHSDVVLLVVADGVGGHKGGEVASKLAVDSIHEYVEKSVLQAHSGGGYGSDWLELTLSHAVFETNARLIKQQQENIDLNNMATTVVAMLFHKNECVVSYLGDSRCYQFTDNALLQITEDHSMLQKLLNEGKINQHEFETSPMHHMISQALGLTSEPDVQVSRLGFDNQTSYLLCSDGLTNCVSDAQIQHILSSNQQLEATVDELITKANDNGGIDNISVVLVKSVS